MPPASTPGFGHQAPRISRADSAQTSDGRPNISSHIVPMAMLASVAGASAEREGRDGSNSGGAAVSHYKFMLVAYTTGITQFGRGVGDVPPVFAPGTSCTSVDATPLFGPAAMKAPPALGPTGGLATATTLRVLPKAPPHPNGR